MPTPRPAVLFPWKCSQCLRTEATGAARRPHARTFATTTIRSRGSRSLNNEALDLPPSQRIAPESPRYVDIPRLIQPESNPIQRRKGVLPIPRSIFPDKDPHALEKASTSRLDAIRDETRRTRDPRGVTPAQAALNDWKTRLATQRRDNLRHGLAALASRTRRRRAIQRRKQDDKQAQRARDVAAADRPDEYLTRPSTTKHIAATQRNGIADPDREARLAAKTARAEMHAAARETHIREGLHDLYTTAARGFIVTEAALERAIEAEFGSQERPKHWRADSPSIWALGPQPGVRELVAAAGSAPGREDDGRSELMKARLRKVAEQLTGGKM